MKEEFSTRFLKEERQKKLKSVVSRRVFVKYQLQSEWEEKVTWVGGNE